MCAARVLTGESVAEIEREMGCCTQKRLSSEGTRPALQDPVLPFLLLNLIR